MSPEGHANVESQGPYTHSTTYRTSTDMVYAYLFIQPLNLPQAIVLCVNEYEKHNGAVRI